MQTRTYPLLLVALLSTAAVAQNETAVPAPAPRMGGEMTHDQFINRQSERMMAADTNGDGKISRAEFAAQARGGKRDPGRLFDRIDANHDGYLDKGEIHAVVEQRFQRLDANKDGVITAEERAAMRGPGHMQDGGATPNP